MTDSPVQRWTKAPPIWNQPAPVPVLVWTANQMVHGKKLVKKPAMRVDIVLQYLREAYPRKVQPKVVREALGLSEDALRKRVRRLVVAGDVRRIHDGNAYWCYQAVKK